MIRSGVQTDVSHRLLSRLDQARARTDALFEVVPPAGLYERTIPERHRLIFYLGHLEAFDWNLLGRGTFEREPFHESFDKLFAFGIDPTDGNLPSDEPSDWPKPGEIRTYNQGVRRRLDRCLRDSDWSDPARPFLGNGTIVHAIIEHRLMHAETLAYLIHHLPQEKKVAQPEPSRPSAPPATPRMVKIPAGYATLGLVRSKGEAFGWDNEFESHTVEVPEFAIDVFPVTNRQYLEFVRAGGYRDSTVWSPEDWQWREEQGVAHPYLWLQEGEQWRYRAMFGQIALPLDGPVYVSHAEASAYCRWAGKSLPTEAQWHRAAYGTPDGRERAYPWGNEPPHHRRGNFDFQQWNTTPVSAYPEGASAFGVADLLGNGWEWTSTRFGPFPGFEPYPFYPGYSADFFDGRHYVMKGGSMRTAACMLRRSFRNWFQPHYPYIYTTFRCVEVSSS